MVVVEELRGGIHILGAPFSGSESLVGKLRGRHFSGLEGAWLCLTNSGAALASWGAVFTCLGAQRAAFLGLEGARLWLRNSRAIFASWGAVFRFRVLGWEAQRAAFFRFRGRLIVFDKLRGGTWILGRRFHLFGSSEGGIFRLRECLIVVAEFRAAFASWEAVFQEQRALGWSDRVQRAAFLHVHRAHCLQSSRGGIFSKGYHFSEQVSNCSSVITQKDERRGAFGG